jgi:hypothetical protein
MYDTATQEAQYNKQTVSGSHLARESELERAVSLVTQQSELLSRLEDRLRGVSNTQPTDADHASPEVYPHIAVLNSVIVGNNDKINYLLETLVI